MGQVKVTDSASSQRVQACGLEQGTHAVVSRALIVVLSQDDHTGTTGDMQQTVNLERLKNGRNKWQADEVAQVKPQSLMAWRARLTFSDIEDRHAWESREPVQPRNSAPRDRRVESLG